MLSVAPVKGMVPGDKMAPVLAVTDPPMLPSPPNIAPLDTVTGVAPSEPSTRRLPAVTAVEPV